MGDYRLATEQMSKSTNQLVLRDFGGIVEITTEAWELKRKALALAQKIARVETAEQQVAAVDALRELRAVMTGMESTRKAVKAPVIKLGKDIDGKAHGFIHDVEKQAGRLQGLINHFQKRQLRETREEEKKVEAEISEAAKKRQKASELRLRAEDEQNPKKAETLLQFANDLDKEAFDLEMTAELAVVTPADKPKGLVVKQRINFQVIDPVVFCQAYPQFWVAATINNHDNELLRVDRMKVLDELNKEGGGLFHRTRFPEELSSTDDPTLVQPAGLRVFEDLKAHIR